MSNNKKTLEERFWEKVEIIPFHNCWEWVAYIRKDGRGEFRFKGKAEKAHRVSWEIHNGPILNGLHVLHKCDNPTCVRPDHLFLGTHQDNMADMLEKKRHSFFGRRDPICKYGHFFSDENTRLRSRPYNGRSIVERVCRTCEVTRSRIGRGLRPVGALAITATLYGPQRKRLKRQNKTKFRGVCADRSGRGFAASIFINKKAKYLGYFKTAEDAALAYDKAALTIFGVKAVLNFDTEK